MTDLQIWDLLGGSSFIVFGALMAGAALSLRRLNEGCTKPNARFYDRFASGSLAAGNLVVAFGAGVIGNTFLGVF